MVLRKILGPTNKEVTERWRKMHKEFRALYSSQNYFFFRVIK